VFRLTARACAAVWFVSFLSNMTRVEIKMGQSAALLATDEALGQGVQKGRAKAGGPAIDLVHLSRQTLGDSALEMELLGLFDRQAEQLAARLREPFRKGEANWRGDLAHTLKGSACAIGAFGVSCAAEAYERGARAGASDLPTLFDDLDAAITTARSAIRRLLERAG
jgi:HPt (histidine-containing phosphotransfer) domain-containing protein